MTREDTVRKTGVLLKGAAVYGIGTVGSKILSFLLVPVYTYYISAGDMGVYDLLRTTAGLLTPMITMQISDAAFRWMIRRPMEKERYIRAVLQVLILNCLGAVLLLAAAGRLAPIPWEGWFILTLVTTRILNTLQKLLRGLHNQRLYASSGILHTLVYLLSNILLICVLRKGIVSLFLSTATADLAAVLVILIREKRLRVSPVSRPDRALIRKMLAFSAPLVPNQLNWWIISSSDRYLIRIFLGAAANGIYAVSCKFPAMLQILLNLFNNSWQDLSVGEEGAEKGGYYSRVFRRLYRFSFSLLWPLIPATRLYITGAMAPAYHSAAEYAAFLYLGTVFQCFSSFYGVGYLRDKNTRQASLTSIYGAVINAGVNFALIRGLGLQAASISTFLGFAAMWAVRERQNREGLGITIHWGEFAVFTLITAVVCTASCFTGPAQDLWMLGSGGGAFLWVNRDLVRKIRDQGTGKLHF